MRHKDRVRQAVATGGTGNLVLGAASNGYQTLGAADDGEMFPYVIEDGLAWETGFGTYTYSGTTFARTTRKDSSTGAALNVSTSAYLRVGWIAALGQRVQLAEVVGTDADTTMAVNTRYDVDMSGWATADRSYTLPTSATLGDEIEVYVQVGDNSHSLILKTGTGQTCAFAGSTIAAATEITSLFITGEKMRFRYQATNKWECVDDGRIPCMAYLNRAAAQAINNNTITKVLFDTAGFNVGGIGDVTTNDRVDIRRAGKYDCIASWQAVMGGAAQSQSRIHITGTERKTDVRGAAIDLPTVSEKFDLVKGDYVEEHVYQVSGVQINTQTPEPTRPRLTVVELL